MITEVFMVLIRSALTIAIMNIEVSKMLLILWAIIIAIPVVLTSVLGLCIICRLAFREYRLFKYCLKAFEHFHRRPRHNHPTPPPRAATATDDTFRLLVLADSPHECRRVLAKSVNVIISYEYYKELSEMDVGSGEAGVRTDCVFCLEEFEATDACVVLGKCRHVFHQQCVQQWMKMNRPCPICNSQIPMGRFA